VTALIAKLPLGSLLALRVTCKTTRKWVDADHQSILAERLKDIRVSPRTWSRTGRTFEELPAALPFSNFDLQLPAPEMYETPEFIGLRRRFGPHIRQLEVYSFWKCKLEGEWDFFESLVNLEQLTIHKISTRPYDSTPSRIPNSSIRNLKSLTIRQSEQLEDPASVHPYSLQMFETALKLETFAPAYVTRIVENESFSQGFRNNLEWFSQSWDRRTTNLLATNGKETLRNIKLWECLQSHYREDATITENFPDWIEFVRRLLDQSSPEIKLGNVTPAMLVSLKDEPDELQRRFADRIVSIQSFKWSMRNFELPNLEELLGFDSVPEPIIDDGSVHPQWPKLNKLATDKFTNRVS
jgi:hypothetical protein